MLSCSCFVSFVLRLSFDSNRSAQQTNQNTVAPLILQMVHPLALESPGFLFIRQNLSRATTAEQSGPKVVKAHSTYTRPRYFKEVAKVNILIPSAPFLLPTFSLAKPKARTLQGPHGAWSSPLLPMVKKCHDSRLRIP
jgi:hypothetical protein